MLKTVKDNIIELETQVATLVCEKDGHVFSRPMSSTITDKMLALTFKYCTRYLSDIYAQFLWMDDEVAELLQDKRKNVIHIIAFRECGVDGNTYIQSKTPYDDEYKSLWTYTAYIRTESWGGKYFIEQFKEVTPDEANDFIKKYFNSKTYALKEQYR